MQYNDFFHAFQGRRGFNIPTWDSQTITGHTEKPDSPFSDWKTCPASRFWPSLLRWGLHRRRSLRVTFSSSSSFGASLKFDSFGAELSCSCHSLQLCGSAAPSEEKSRGQKYIFVPPQFRSVKRFWLMNPVHCIKTDCLESDENVCIFLPVLCSWARVTLPVSPAWTSWHPTTSSWARRGQWWPRLSCGAWHRDETRQTTKGAGGDKQSPWGEELKKVSITNGKSPWRLQVCPFITRLRRKCLFGVNIQAQRGFLSCSAGRT